MVSGLAFWQWFNTRKTDRALAEQKVSQGAIDSKQKEFHFSNEIADFWKTEALKLQAEVGQLRDDNRQLNERLYAAQLTIQEKDAYLIEVTNQRTYCQGWLCKDSSCGRRNPQNKTLKGLRFAPELAGMPPEEEPATDVNSNS